MRCILGKRHILAMMSGATMIAAPALAQVSPTLGVEATTDERRRGLSWSEGQASASGDVLLPVGPVDASARIAATRGSGRHGGADAVIDLGAGTGWDVGAIRLRATVTGHLFTGARGRIDYVEAGGTASYGIGPLRVTGGAMLAPSQDAIGGSNLHLFADADAGIPGTPVTLVAGIGHSSGGVDDPVRAQRLRPGGDYTNWRLGIEHRQGQLTLALDYTGTDIGRDDAFGPFADARHAGDRILGRVRFGL
ncbi:TorF family putative porin [Sphingomonas cynarae]